MSEEYDLLFLSSDDFDAFLAAFTSAGALVMPYADPDDGWRCLAVGVPGFPVELKLAFMDELKSGECLPIKRFKPEVTVFEDGGWRLNAFRYEWQTWPPFSSVYLAGLH